MNSFIVYLSQKKATAVVVIHEILVDDGFRVNGPLAEAGYIAIAPTYFREGPMWWRHQHFH